MARLTAARPMSRTRPEIRPRRVAQPDAWWRLLRWLVPAAAAAVVVVAILVWRFGGPGSEPSGQPVTASASAALRPDDVQINRRLVAVFDAVARMPGGALVRFRCREWADEVVLRDLARVGIKHFEPRAVMELGCVQETIDAFREMPRASSALGGMGRRLRDLG